MADDWSFWLRALAGEKPQSMVQGVPEQGFWLLRERWTTRTPEGDRKVGGPRHKVSTHFHPVAIWKDESAWHCVITRPGKTSYLNDPSEIDETVFSRCSQAPITHDDYLAKVKELEKARERDSANQPETQSSVFKHDERDRSAQHG